MSIELSQNDVATALPKVRPGLEKYLRIQSMIRDDETYHASPVFRRCFNGFYRVRRAESWQCCFYQLMARARGLSFEEVLNQVLALTNRLEVSFSTKLVASLDPSLPVIDAFVLKNVGLKLAPVWKANRAKSACEVFEALKVKYAEFLAKEDGKALVREFRTAYPGADVTELKMVDLVLWQTRAA